MINQPYIHTTDVHNTRSSDIVAPILMKMFNPASVLDVGCGIGTWLASFTLAGVHDVFGVDGDFVDRSLLKQHIPEQCFTAADLTKGIELGRKFDLVLSLEVAEHLPEQSAERFIQSLCEHGDTIVFSAAIPHQGGQNHLNEQWKSYWIEKFKAHGFRFYDLLRPLLWNIQEVDWWYKQNMVVFSRTVLEEHSSDSDLPLEAVHPDLLKNHIDYIIYLQEYVKELETKL